MEVPAFSLPNCCVTPLCEQHFQLSYDKRSGNSYYFSFDTIHFSKIFMFKTMDTKVRRNHVLDVAKSTNDVAKSCRVRFSCIVG